MRIASLNSATKYPSILTYHALGEKGRLKPELVAEPPAQPLEVYEKVDGTNARVIVSPDGDFYIGSREDLLYAKGDRIINPALNIVETLLPWVDELSRAWRKMSNGWGVFFGEVYGANIGSEWKNYASTVRGFRVFDIIAFENVPAFMSLISQTPDRVAAWRDTGGQVFLTTPQRAEICDEAGVPEVPTLSQIAALPRTVQETYDWLCEVCPKSKVVLDGGLGEPEGVVVRTPGREFIAKIRFEDYCRTLFGSKKAPKVTA